VNVYLLLYTFRDGLDEHTGFDSVWSTIDLAAARKKDLLEEEWAKRQHVSPWINEMELDGGRF